jgi:hypothetical protein
MSAPTASPPPTSPPPAQPARRPGTGPVGVFGWVLAVVAVLLALGGAAAVVIHLTQRDDDGYFTTSSERFQSAGFAVTAQDLNLGDLAGSGVIQDVLGHVRVTAEAPSGRPLFVGIAPTSDLNRYLGRVGHSEVTNVDGSDITYRQHTGGPPAGPPARQSFWNAQAVGTGTQTATWKVQSGNWSVAVMNASGSRPVVAEIDLGAKTTVLLWIGVGLLALALVLAGMALLLITQDPRRKVAPEAVPG